MRFKRYKSNQKAFGTYENNYEEVKNGTLRDRKSYRKWIETLRAGLPENNGNSIDSKETGNFVL